MNAFEPGPGGCGAGPRVLARRSMLTPTPTTTQVFHSRDLRATERLDYFSAGAVMVYDVYLSCLRVSGV